MFCVVPLKSGLLLTFCAFGSPKKVNLKMKPHADILVKLICVQVQARERQRQRETDRQRHRERETERESREKRGGSERERDLID